MHPIPTLTTVFSSLRAAHGHTLAHLPWLPARSLAAAQPAASFYCPLLAPLGAEGGHPVSELSSTCSRMCGVGSHLPCLSSAPHACFQRRHTCPVLSSSAPHRPQAWGFPPCVVSILRPACLKLAGFIPCVLFILGVSSCLCGQRVQAAVLAGALPAPPSPAVGRGALAPPHRMHPPRHNSFCLWRSAFGRPRGVTFHSTPLGTLAAELWLAIWHTASAWICNPGPIPVPSLFPGTRFS